MWFENQFPYFFWMILCGTGIMFFYDFLRIRRKLVKFADFIVNLEDILYFCVSAIAVYYLTYIKNDGEIRIQTLLGLLIGCLIYFFVIGNRFVVIGTKLVRCISKFIKVVFKIVFFPIAVILKILKKPARVVVWYTGKSCKSIKYKLELKFKNLKHLFRKK